MQTDMLPVLLRWLLSMRRGILAVLVLAGCVTAPNQLCTVEDQQAGTCIGPAGGWDALRQRTEQTAVDIEPAATGAPLYCSSYSDGRKYCNLSISTPGHLLVVQCWETSPGGSVDCTWSWG